MSELNVISVSQLNDYAKGVVIELPPFAEGQPLTARVRRPSLMVLAKSGKIPNPLLGTANALFNNPKALDIDEDQLIIEMASIMDIVAEASLIEPSLEEIKAAGLDLTDQQYVTLFNYSQKGVQALDSFRTE